ncbi:hypothetical protein ACQKEN_06195 [Pseudomonas sp. NPDC078416]|uniref:hypothetical protein n=1 Tax=Pseudomonas sp. NPDC078416 TaxID=3390637 RepID=UPI003CFF35D0
MDNLRQIEKKADGRAACKGITPDRDSDEQRAVTAGTGIWRGRNSADAHDHDPGVLRAQWSTDHSKDVRFSAEG